MCQRIRKGQTTIRLDERQNPPKPVEVMRDEVFIDSGMFELMIPFKMSVDERLEVKKLRDNYCEAHEGMCETYTGMAWGYAKSGYSSVKGFFVKDFTSDVNEIF